MKVSVACFSVAAALGCGEGLSQGVGDITEKMRVCSLLDQANRLQCLEKLSREIAPTAEQPSAAGSAARTPGAGRWIVSETMSPIDYSPVAIATGMSDDGPQGETTQLSIRCRSGRTELIVLAPTLLGRTAGYSVSYQVNGGERTILPIGSPSSGKGLAIKGDVIRLLASLPSRGELSIEIAGRQEPPVRGKYMLAELNRVLARLVAPCRWPAIAKP